MKTDRTGSELIGEGINTFNANTSAINTGESTMKNNDNGTIEKDKGEEVIEVVRSSFSEKDLLNVNLIDSHRLKFSIPSSSQSIMGSQDLHISYDCDEDLLSYKLCFSKTVPRTHIEATQRFLHLVNTQLCSHRYLCNGESGAVTLNLDHFVMHESLNETIAKRILWWIFSESLHIDILLHWLVTQDMEPVELYTKYLFVLENIYYKMNNAPDSASIIKPYKRESVYEEIQTLFKGLYGTEPIGDPLGHGMLVYDFDVVEDLLMRLLMKFIPWIEAISVRFTTSEAVPDNKVRPVTELLSRLNLMSRINHLTLNPKNHCIYLHQGIFLEQGKFSARDLHQALSTAMSHSSLFFPLINELVTSDISVKELLRRIEKENHPDCFLGHPND